MFKQAVCKFILGMSILVIHSDLDPFRSGLRQIAVIIAEPRDSSDIRPTKTTDTE